MSDSLSIIVGIAPGISLRCFFILKLAAISVYFSKYYFVKCSLHKTEDLVEPFQLALVLCLTCFVHSAHNVGSGGGNQKQLTPSPDTLEQLKATHHLDIVFTSVNAQLTHTPFQRLQLYMLPLLTS